MRKTFGTVDILRGDQFSGPGRRGAASYKGQLFLEEGSGNYYKALAAGPNVEFERVTITSPSKLFSDPYVEENLKSTIGAEIATEGTPARAALNTAFGPLVEVTPPPGFTLGVPFEWSVYRTALGLYVLDINVDALRPAAGRTYYVSPTGTTGGDGLTSGTPTTLPTAIGKADVGTIVFLPGEYYRNDHTAPLMTAKSLNMIGRDGAILTGFEKPSNLTWVSETGNIYRTTRGSTVGVIDKRAEYMDENGDYPVYEQVADLAAITKAGQWALVSSTLYVWALGNANLASDASFLRVNLDSGALFRVEGANTLYIENLQMEGGGNSSRGSVDVTNPSGSAARPKLIAVDCSVKYSPAKGFRVQAADYSILIRCKASSTVGDGFSYHTGTVGGVNYGARAIEVDCQTTNTGLFGTSQTDNGSTAHGTSTVLRLNGLHVNSLGPAVAEDSGAKSWNLGVTAGRSSRASTRYWAFCASAVGSEQWIEDCAIPTSQRAGIAAVGASAAHVRRARSGSLLGYSAYTSDGGTVTTY